MHLFVFRLDIYGMGPTLEMRDGLKSGSVFYLISPSLGALIGQTLHMFMGNGASRVSLLLAWIFERTKFSQHCRFLFYVSWK